MSGGPERNGRRTSAACWDIAGPGAGDPAPGAREGERRRACDGGAGGDLAHPGSSSVAAPTWSLEPWRGGRPSPGRTCPRRDAPALAGTQGTPPSRATHGSGCCSSSVSRPAPPALVPHLLSLGLQDRAEVSFRGGQACAQGRVSWPRKGPASEIHRHVCLERSVFNWTGPSFTLSCV